MLRSLDMVALRTALQHVETRLSDHAWLDSIGPLVELNWLQECSWSDIPLVSFPHTAAALELSERILAGSIECITWSEHSLGVLYASALAPRRMAVRLSESLVERQSQCDPLIEAAGLRVGMAASAETPAMLEVEQLGAAVAAHDEEQAARFLAELLPFLIRSDPSSRHWCIALMRSYVRFAVSSEVEVRIRNVVALCWYSLRDYVSAVEELEAAFDAAARVADPTLRQVLESLVLSNRSRVEFESDRSQSSATRCIARAVRVAPNNGRWCGAFWFHACRGIRLAQSEGAIADVLSAIAARVPDFRPVDLGADPLYCIRKYRSFVQESREPMALMSRSHEWRAMESHVIGLIDEHLPGWPFFT